MSLETFFHALLLTSKQSHQSCKETLVPDLHMCLGVLVLPVCYFRSVLNYECSNPFIGMQQLLPPCGASCAFCLGKCVDVFLDVGREGATSKLIDFFVGSSRIEVFVTISEALLKDIRMS